MTRLLGSPARHTYWDGAAHPDECAPLHSAIMGCMVAPRNYVLCVAGLDADCLDEWQADERLREDGVHMTLAVVPVCVQPDDLAAVEWWIECVEARAADGHLVADWSGDDFSHRLPREAARLEPLITAAVVRRIREDRYGTEADHAA